MSHELIQLKGIGKSFANTNVLRGVDLDISEGEYLAITGPSGSGKSTLLSIIGLLEEPSSGRYLFKGRDTSSANERQSASIRNKELGWIFQNFNLIGDMTVYENVSLPLRYSDIEKNQRQAKIAHLLEQVGLSHKSNAYPSELSGGQQQRVAIARALVTEPSIILADEPTGNLDSENTNNVMELLAKLHREGKTIVMITHDIATTNFASRVISIKDGCILN